MRGITASNIYNNHGMLAAEYLNLEMNSLTWNYSMHAVLYEVCSRAKSPVSLGFESEPSCLHRTTELCYSSENASGIIYIRLLPWLPHFLPIHIIQVTLSFPISSLLHKQLSFWLSSCFDSSTTHFNFHFACLRNRPNSIFHKYHISNIQHAFHTRHDHYCHSIDSAPRKCASENDGDARRLPYK